MVAANGVPTARGAVRPGPRRLPALHRWHLSARALPNQVFDQLLAAWRARARRAPATLLGMWVAQLGMALPTTIVRGGIYLAAWCCAARQAPPGWCRHTGRVRAR